MASALQGLSDPTLPSVFVATLNRKFGAFTFICFTGILFAVFGHGCVFTASTPSVLGKVIMKPKVVNELCAFLSRRIRK